MHVVLHAMEISFDCDRLLAPGFDADCLDALDLE